MFGIASIVSFSLALFLWLSSVHQGHFLTWTTFVITGLLCGFTHLVTGWWPTRHGT